MRKKRGISPLIATVLILGFTIALAAVIMTWGTSFTKKIQKETEAGADISIICATQVNFDITDACIDGTDVKITVKNDASKTIDSFKVRLYKGGSEVDTPSDLSSLGSFDISTYKSTPNTFTAGEVKMVELFPTITSSGSSITCAENVDQFGNLDADSLPNC